jgi:hypothetical protein
MRTWILAATASLAVGTAAQALYMEWGPWKPGQSVNASFWPKGADALANRKERTGGHMLNSFDHFLYQGDAAALNAFLTDAAKVQGSRSIMLIGGEERVGLTNPRLEGADWTMSVSANSHVGVFLPSDGKVKLQDLKLPANVPLESWGEVGADVKRIVEEHEKKRKMDAAAPMSCAD